MKKIKFVKQMLAFFAHKFFECSLRRMLHFVIVLINYFVYLIFNYFEKNKICQTNANFYKAPQSLLCLGAY